MLILEGQFLREDGRWLGLWSGSYRSLTKRSGHWRRVNLLKIRWREYGIPALQVSSAPPTNVTVVYLRLPFARVCARAIATTFGRRTLSGCLGRLMLLWVLKVQK